MKPVRPIKLLPTMRQRATTRTGVRTICQLTAAGVSGTMRHTAAARAAHSTGCFVADSRKGIRGFHCKRGRRGDEQRHTRWEGQGACHACSHMPAAIEAWHSLALGGEGRQLACVQLR